MTSRESALFGGLPAVSHEVMIPTARGDAVPVSALGVTLPSELVIQETPEIELGWPDLEGGKRQEHEQIASALAALKRLHEAGVRSVVDSGIPPIGRNVPKLQKIAQQTKVNILVGTGHYLLRDLNNYFHHPEQFTDLVPHHYLPGHHDQHGEHSGACCPQRGVQSEHEDLEKVFVRDIEEGIGSTGVRAASIRIVIDRPAITEDTLKIIQASCRAHRRTGAPIFVQGVRLATAEPHLKLLADEGVDPTRVTLGRAGFARRGTHLAEFERVLDKGFYTSFDGWSPGEETSLSDRNAEAELMIKRIAELILKGYRSQLLISPGNSAFTEQLPLSFRFGLGNVDRPCMVLADWIVPKLKEIGVADRDITEITTTNPARFMGSIAKGGY